MHFIDGKLAQFGSKPGLERIRKMMEELGNPQKDMRVLIVAGTNGKGSVTSYISSVLATFGKKTGSYYSPHLIDYTERFMINGKKITKKKLEKYEAQMESLFNRGFEMTAFEALTGICFQYFKDESVEFAIMEAGMGGEFDATAIADPEIGIITNVSLEHTEYLGDTIEKIAGTKARIFRKGSTGVTGCSGPALKTIESIAKTNDVGVSALGRDFFIHPIEISSRRTVFNYLGKTHYPRLETSLLGRHQADNCGIALAALEQLDEEIPEDAIRKGIKKAENPGRLQLISKNPLIVIDAAHNPAGIGSLVSSLSLFDFDRLIVVFGVLANKDWKQMIGILVLHADMIIANKQKHENATDPDEIVKEASRFCEAKKVEDVKGSLEYAKSIAGKKDMIVVCGSIYMLGELLG